jgi:hypothetical protein
MAKCCADDINVNAARAQQLDEGRVTRLRCARKRRGKVAKLDMAAMRTGSAVDALAAHKKLKGMCRDPVSRA